MIKIFSHAILKRFVKDYNLPIQVLQLPYFEYFLDLYNRQYKTYDKYELLSNTIAQLGNENNFMEEYHRIKDNILNTIKQNPIFTKFNNDKLDQYNIPNLSYQKHDVFHYNNDNKCFISIDLRKANFQAMKYYDKNFVLGFDNYESFMYNFTDLDYMVKSKIY